MKIIRNISLFILFGVVILFFTIIPSPASAEYHDLSIVSITTSPSPPVFNMENTVTVKVKYVGDETLTTRTGFDSYSYNFKYFDKSQITLPTIDSSHPLATDSEVSYVFTGVFTEIGTISLSFLVNEGEVLSESKLSNNDLRVTMDVIEPEDLTVSRVVLNPAAPTVSQPCTITYYVKNSGHRRLITPIGLQDFTFTDGSFQEDDRTLPTVSGAAPFEPNDEIEYVFEGEFLNSGDQELEFIIDKDNRIRENNEDNNSLSTTINIGSTASLDYSVESITASKDLDKLIFGDDLSITVIVKNNSEYSITSEDGLLERDYHYTSGGDYEFSFPRLNINEPTHSAYPSADNPFEPGETFSYVFPGSISEAGAGEISFRIDVRGKLVESDETNNDLLVPYIIYSNVAERDEFGIIKNVVTKKTTASATIMVQTDKEADCELYYRDIFFDVFDRYMLKYELEEWPNTTDSLEHIFNLDNLQIGIEYRYLVKCSINNVKKETDLKSFTTALTDEEIIAPLPEEIVETTESEESSSVEETTSSAESMYFNSSDMFQRLKGRIMLKVEDAGKAYYANPKDQSIHYLGRPADAFGVMRDQGVGIKTSDLEKIEVGLSNLTGPDSDSDGLPDLFEDAVSTNKNNKDSDNDGYEDKYELEGGYNPSGSGEINIDNNFAESQKGKIFLQVEGNGEAWYVNPKDNKRYFLGRPADAFAVMRNLGLGISNNDFDKL